MGKTTMMKWMMMMMMMMMMMINFVGSNAQWQIGQG